MIRVGIVGFGYMGRMHYRCWSALEGVRITAACDADAKAFTSSNAASGNISGAANDIDLAGIRTFTSFDDLLTSGAVDVVSITLPTHMHPAFTIKALAAGMHVLCEKPMALTLEDCDRMIAAAAQYKRLLQIGHCIRFWPEYVATRELVRSGEFGRVIGAAFHRYSPMPAWSTVNWLADEKRSGGMPLDLHIHDADFIHYLFGMPRSVMSVGDSAMSHIHTTFLYDNGPVVSAEASWRTAPSLGFSMGFRITLEKATVVFDSLRAPAFRVYPHEGEPFTPPLVEGDGYSGEIVHFAEKIRGVTTEDVITLDQSRETVRLVLAEKESARRGSPVDL